MRDKEISTYGIKHIEYLKKCAATRNEIYYARDSHIFFSLNNMFVDVSCQENFKNHFSTESLVDVAQSFTECITINPLH